MKRYKKRSSRKGKYKSKLEATIARILGRKATYETETINYLLPKRYKPDFVVTISGRPHEAPRKVYVEVKGWFRYEDQQKMRAVKFSNPDLDIRMYFPNDNKVQGSRMTNSEWCRKWGFPYVVGEIPKGWIK